MRANGLNLICSKIPTLVTRWRVLAASALLVWAVVVRIPAVQSQGFAATGAAADAEAYLKRGEVSAGAHEYDRALAHYNTAIRLRPDYAEAYNDRGHAYYWKGEHRRAIADFTRAIELRPAYPNAYNNRGAAYMASGNAGKSIAEFSHALKLKADFRNAYVNRANAYLRTGHLFLALDNFHRAGMHPERSAAMLGGAILLVAVAGTAMAFRRKRLQRTSGTA